MSKFGLTRNFMKIAHLISQFYPYLGGAEICVHNVCRMLSKSSLAVAEGHKAVVITTTTPPNKKPDVPYEIVYLSPKTCGMLRKIPLLGTLYLHNALAKLQKKYDFDLWQVTMGYPLGAYAVDFFKKHNIPCILRCCGEDIQKFPGIDYGYRLDSKIDKLISKKYPLFDGFVALTPSVKEEYLKLGIPEEKIRIIPNGVDSAKFSDCTKRRTNCEIRKKLGADDNKTLILTVGRYHPKKGFDLIPHIAKILKEKDIDFIWVIAGKKSSEIRKKFPECESLNIKTIEDFESSTDTEFNLPSIELINLYCSADIFVLPTLLETFGMVLVEAMAAGLPVVTTDAPGVRDVIEDGVNGLKAPVNDVERFAELIIKLIANPELAGRLIKNARREAGEKYDWQRVTTQYQSFYGEILNQDRRLLRP